MLRQPGNIVLAVLVFGLVAVAGFVIVNGALGDDDGDGSAPATQAELEPEQRVLFSQLGMT